MFADPSSANIGEYSARPSALMARMSMRPLRTYAADDVMESSIHCTLGRTSACLRLRGVRLAGRAARARSNR